MFFISMVCCQIDSLLKNGGGKKHSYLSDMISHVIAGDGDNEEVTVAKELFQLPVITVCHAYNILIIHCMFFVSTFDRGQTTQTLANQHSSFEHNSLTDRKPMQIAQHRFDVVEFRVLVIERAAVFWTDCSFLNTASHRR